MSSPISDLTELLASLEVSLLDGVWAYETTSFSIDPDPDAIMAFKERESLTQICPAKSDTPESNRWHWIEVSVHSDLNAVGFLARLAGALAKAGVPCNAIAGYYHDHIFVPVDKTETALTALRDLKSA